MPVKQKWRVEMQYNFMENLIRLLLRHTVVGKISYVSIVLLCHRSSMYGKGQPQSAKRTPFFSALK